MSRPPLWLLGISAILFTADPASAQSLANYAPSRTAGIPYASIATTGTSFAAWRNGASTDDNRTAPTGIGFTFHYDGRAFTQFSLSTNGYLDLSSASAIGSTHGAYGYQNSQFSAVSGTLLALAPFHDDLVASGNTGTLASLHASFKYQLDGAPGSRVLTVEWIDMAHFSDPGAELDFQVRLHENGAIEFRYGTMNGGSANLSYTVGINGPSLSATPQASELRCQQVANTASFGGTPQNSLAAVPASNSELALVPAYQVTPADPGNLTFTAVSTQGVTVSWTDASTTETYFTLSRSTDGVDFSPAGTVTSSTASATGGVYSALQSGLLPATTYHFRITANNEASPASGALAGSQATSPVGAVTSVATGNWNAPSTWSTGSVPTTADAVTIADGHTVTINAAAACLDLDVGQGSSGILEYEATTPRILSVGRDLRIRPGGTLRSAATGSITSHVLSVARDMTNDGTLDLSTNGNFSAAGLIFAGTGPATLSGTGPTTDLRSLTLSKSGPTDVVEVRPVSLTVRGSSNDGYGFLNLVRGTCRIAGSFAATSFLFTSGSYTIPATAGLWLDNPAFTVTALSGSPTVAGTLRVSAGGYNVGIFAGQSLGLATGSAISVEGGTVTVAGRLGVSSPANTVTYIQSGGTVTVNTATGHNSTTLASFDLGTSASSRATWSGGTIVLQNAGTGGAGPRDFRNQVGTTTVTGGTLQLGNGASGAAKTFRLTGHAPGLLVTNTSAAHTAALVANTTVSGSAEVRSGATLMLGGFTLALAGPQLVNDGLLHATAAGSRLHFMGSGPQSYRGAGAALPLDGVVIDNPAGVAIDPGITGNLTTLRAFLLQGTLINSARLTLGDGFSPSLTQIGAPGQILPGGSFDASPTFNVAAGGYSLSYLSEVGPRTTGFEIPSSRVAASATIDNPQGVTLAGGALRLTAALTLAQGVLRTSAADVLTLASSVPSAPPGSAASHVDGPLAIEFGAGAPASRDFAIGRGGAYRPLRLQGVDTGGVPQIFTAEVVPGPLGGTPSPPLTTLARTRSWRLANTVSLNPSARVVLSFGADDAIASLVRARVGQAIAVDGAYFSRGGVATGRSAAGSVESTLDLVPGGDFFAIGLEGDPITWDGGAGTSRWADGLNWSSDSVPGPADVVVLHAEAPATISVEEVFAVGDLEIGNAVAVQVGSGSLTVNRSFRLAGGTLRAGIGTVHVLGPADILDGLLESGSALVELDGSCTVAGGIVRLAAGGRLLAGGLTITGGTLDLGAGTLEVRDDFAWSSGTFTAGTGTSIFSGQAGQSIGGGVTHHDLILRNGGSAGPKILTAGEAFTVDGDFIVEASAQLGLSAAQPTTLRVAGDFAHAGLAGGAHLASLAVRLTGIDGWITGGSGANQAGARRPSGARASAIVPHGGEGMPGRAVKLEWRTDLRGALLERGAEDEKPLPVLVNTYARRRADVERLLETTDPASSIVLDLDDRTIVRHAASRAATAAASATAPPSELEMDVTVESGARYRLGDQVSIAAGRTLHLEGRLDCGAFAIAGAGGLLVNRAGVIGTAVDDPVGLDATVLVSGASTYMDGAIVEYNAGGDQTIAAAAHPSLALLHTGGSGTKTLDADLSLAGNSGSLLLGAALLVGSGTTFADGGHRLSFTSPFFANVIVRGAYASTGTGAISYEAGPYLSNLLAQDGTVFGDLILNFAASLQRLDMNANGTARVTFRNLLFGGTAGSGTAGGTLRLSEAGATHVTVSGDVSIAPAAAANTGGGFAGTATAASTVTLLGNLTSTSTASAQPILDAIGANMLILAGSAPQTLSLATSASVLGGVTLRVANGSGVVLAGSGRTYTLGGVLELAGGTVTTGSNILALAPAGSVLRTSGHVVGTLQKAVPAVGAASRSFEIGSDSGYAPLSLVFTSVTGAGTIATSTAPGDHPGIGSSNLDPSRSVNRRYTVTNGGVVFGSCDATFEFQPGDLDFGADPARFVIERFVDPSWFATTTGGRTATSSQALGLTGFGDFAIGEPESSTLTVTADGPGSVSRNPELASYAAGATVELSATADVGQVFQGWSGDVSGTGNPVVVTMDGNKSVTASFGDPGAPPVELVSPSGGRVRVGDTVEVRWTTSGNAGVTAIDLLLSRSGRGGAFDSIAVGIPNTGSHAWQVTAPATANAFFRIVAHDSAGPSGADDGDLALAIIPAAAAGDRSDPLVPMIERIGDYFAANEVDGVTRDPRNLNNPSEEIRLSIVPQLLGYYELFKQDGARAHYDDVVSRADFLVVHFSEITSNTAFDGMLGYALLAAYELTKQDVYLSKATIIVNRCLTLSGFDNTLNWGLMAAMGLAKYYQLTGSPAALAKTREIIDSVRGYQHPDGSFQHYCNGTTDIHYTGWMGMELITVGRLIEYGPIDVILQGINSFLAARVGVDGITQYQDPCPGVPNCWIYYSSRETGCTQDYDTRGWINELGYNAMVLDHYDGPKYFDVMGFLSKLENRGAFDDKWDFMPPPEDPIYPWATASPSVIRTSVVFWSLTSIFASRGRDGVPVAGVDWGARDAVWLEPAVPNPVRRAASFAFGLPAPGKVSLTVWDARGARVRQLVSGMMPPGRSLARWDGRDARGRLAPSGVYFLRLEAGRQVRTAKLVVAR
jgi:List-Bact-rpt repeat protein/fibronectin type III domain protein